MKLSTVKMLSIFLALVIITVSWFILTGKYNKPIAIDKVISINQLVVSAIYIIFYLVIVIFSRIKKQQPVLKAILLYYLVGVLSYLIILFMSVLRETQLSYNISMIFRCWTSLIEPLGIVIARAFGRLVGRLFIERDAIGFLTMSFAIVTALILSGLQKNIAWDKKIVIQAAAEELRVAEIEERARKINGK